MATEEDLQNERKIEQWHIKHHTIGHRFNIQLKKQWGCIDENGKGKISLRAIEESSPFYNLSGSDNMIAFYSDRYEKTPLVIRGPGAGAEVTAAGILAEVINIAKK